MGIVTVDKLENADKDADALDTFINGADTATVTTRKSKKYPTLANAVKQVIETGGFEPFATETALLASRPTITKKAAKALDTKKVWLWDGTQWNDTGLSEYDLAKRDINKVSQKVDTKLTIKYDFHSIENTPSFVVINEDLKVINTLAPNIVMDFHSDASESDLFFADENLKELKPQQEGSGLDVENIPNNEQGLGEPYVDNHYLKVSRKDYPNYYFNTSQSVITHADDVYAFYDNLMSQNPDYITKTTLGADTEGYPIYGYTFTPPPKLYWGGHTAESVQPPEIVITSGVHGAEKMGIIAGMSFFDNLVNYWNTEEYYDKLRFSCKFTIYPACNPYGIRSNTRGNVNGVDLNRNFDVNWDGAGSTDPSDVNYKGSAPFSEIETQLLATIPDLHPNANLFMDLHQQGEVYLFWFGTILDQTITTVVESLNDMTTYLYKHIKPESDLQQTLCRLAYNGEGTLARYFQLVKNKATILIEMSSSNHPMLTGKWVDARKVAEKSIVTVVKNFIKNV
ncbi:DUF2817 domain-containing protein [Acinetobacter equi]|uniref:Peptidase M14 domain-containing protein n=1 Tax=Acinetobacter equi TaxID=1324350 RepID=A0A0N9W256_9GAMM|nr:DUF2817 domain-containing protein [Acinetobacter equi]ALH95599.1 hypothetical protein AOY20_08715 [Acinetobacter equi]